MKKPNILALIPARGGSKGIPRKNIIDIAGYPVIAYSIAVAKLSKYINRVIVTTDDAEIADVSRRFGAEAPFLRPKEISGDKSLDIEFFHHALEWLKKNEEYSPDLIVHLRPTTPFRDFRVVDEAITDMIKDKKATSLRSSEIFDRESPYKMFKAEGAYYDFFGKEDFKKDEEYYNYPRQAFPVTYQPNGYVDIVKPSVLLKTGMLHGKRIRIFVTEKSVELDNLMDVESARKVSSEAKYKELMDFLKKMKR